MRRFLLVPLVVGLVALVTIIVVLFATGSLSGANTDDEFIVLSNGEQINLTNEKIIKLYVSIYKDFMSILSEADLLPDFDTVELVEHQLDPNLNEESKQELIRRLEGMFTYSVSLCDHDRQLTPRSEGTARVFLWFLSDRNFIRANCNEVKASGFINDTIMNKEVILHYSYLNNNWELVRSEIV